MLVIFHKAGRKKKKKLMRLKSRSQDHRLESSALEATFALSTSDKSAVSCETELWFWWSREQNGQKLKPKAQTGGRFDKPSYYCNAFRIIVN